MNVAGHVWGPHGGSIRRTLRRLIRQSGRVLLVSPYVTSDGVQEFIEFVDDKKDVRLIRRLNDRDILSGVLDPGATADLQDAGAKVRFHDDRLHAKLWVFDDQVIIGAANLTGQALSTNVELVVTLDESVASTLANAFSDMWRRLRRRTKDSNELRALAERLRNHPAGRRFQQVAARNGLVDYGGSSESHTAPSPRDSGFWLKVNGLSSERINTITDLRAEYPFEGGQTFRRPGRPSLKEGDLVILTRIGERDGQPDNCIYGRGIVDVAHRPGIDEIPAWLRSVISEEDYEDAQFDRWPWIVWLRDVQLRDGTAADCPWLSQVNRRRLVVERSSLRQQSHIRIADEQAAALTEALERAFNRAGCTRLERPEGIWWNSRINDPRQYVTRYRLETSHDRLTLG